MGRALAVIIWLLTLGSVLLFMSGRWWFPPAITEHGPAVDAQFMRTIIVVGIAFTAAQVGLGYMIWRYRDTGGGERALYTHGNNRLEIVWTVITAAVFISLAVMGQRVWASLHLQGPAPGANRVEVVAQQFQWNFHYPGRDGAFGRTDPKLINDDELNFIGLDDKDPAGKDDPVLSSLAIPVGVPTEFLLRSKDVTHSFWIPQTRFKQDLVPGMEIRSHFTPTKVGQYELACAELCGMNHFKMKAYVLVLPRAEHAALMKLAPSEFQARLIELRQKYQIGAFYDESGNQLRAAR
ncbi:MAG TPA: cytochrome c oxidase subunit II [Pyrinomonadaceae bacterium]